MRADIPDSIAQAFHEARYLVFAPAGTITLRIGQHSLALQSLMAARARDSLAILTAYNPGARQAGIAANHRAQRALLKDASALGLPCFYGRNLAEDENGPAEPTVAILGALYPESCGLARRYGQLAFVFAGSSAVPELIWL
ncbi:DUF3293 domain-containing protein [Pollutimonas sp. M17]|uniref:DUF3293 domain-containing protein n=1 Tax=Pollutimonas sp. M17 TaxID=2962065 RepID=UPI0021F4BF45|nr:DUF3293 domain-containing protein [Pollutimonas sp. M17]UYO92986.1 DUF3293 domain-containing protein [Pollutimonas sp. M17]